MRKISTHLLNVEKHPLGYQISRMLLSAPARESITSKDFDEVFIDEIKSEKGECTVYVTYFPAIGEQIGERCNNLIEALRIANKYLA